MLNPNETIKKLKMCIGLLFQNMGKYLVDRARAKEKELSKNTKKEQTK